MKAHFATLPPVRRGGSGNGGGDADSAFSSSSFSSGEEEQEQESERRELLEEKEKSLGYGLRENPKRSFRFVDPEFLGGGGGGGDSGSVVQDRESDSESRNPTRKRSKRNRKPVSISTLEIKKRKPISSPEFPAEPEPVSSISDTSPEEDVAMCLMMLSRDAWKVKVKGDAKVAAEESEPEEEEIKYYYCPSGNRGRYRCEKCGMSFRSHSALSGHRRICLVLDPGKKKVTFQCPFCDRVFGSGQALGGHKRSHMLSSSSTPATPPRPSKTPIDLNLPAPIEDDEFSVVSYA